MGDAPETGTRLAEMRNGDGSVLTVSCNSDTAWITRVNPTKGMDFVYLSRAQAKLVRNALTKFLGGQQ